MLHPFPGDPQTEILSASNEAPAIPGMGELLTMCANARRVSELCDLFGIPSSSAHHDHLQDHPDPPYIWDL